jgi:glucosamine-phosphate N-acetyltransferase
LFIEKINQIYQFGIIYVGIKYLENNLTIVGTGTIIIEPKLIRATKSVGHIEEIVVHPKFRGIGISSQIINLLKDYAITKDCYKIILSCEENLSKVYEKCGFKQKGIQMSFYL